ncbi:MAG: hypothetical protein ACXV1K_01770, partial [Kineosporiaceae bacterium]
MAAPDAGTPEAPRHHRSPSEWLRERIGAGPAQQQPPRKPWRVEGAQGQGPGQPGHDRPTARSAWTRFWWLLLVLLVVNWIISSLLLSPGARATVSYTFFASL